MSEGGGEYSPERGKVFFWKFLQAEQYNTFQFTCRRCFKHFFWLSNLTLFVEVVQTFKGRIIVLEPLKRGSESRIYNSLNFLPEQKNTFPFTSCSKNQQGYILCISILFLFTFCLSPFIFSHLYHIFIFFPSGQPLHHHSILHYIQYIPLKNQFKE